MRDYDIELLTDFIRRPGLYSGNSNRESINIYLMAYEAGSNGACDFRKKLMDHLSDKYKIEPRSAGLLGQIELISKK